MTRDAIKEFSVKSVHCCTRNLKDLNDESSHQREETSEEERKRERSGSFKSTYKIKYNFYNRGLQEE